VADQGEEDLQQLAALLRRSHALQSQLQRADNSPAARERLLAELERAYTQARGPVVRLLGVELADYSPLVDLALEVARIEARVKAGRTP
jgi:hypothetical protein